MLNTVLWSLISWIKSSVYMELIPGLPNDIARECLVRVKYKQFATIVYVSKEWKSEVELSEFFVLRKNSGTSQKLIVMAQARVSSKKSGSYKEFHANPVYQLVLLEPDTGNWSELPLIPGFSHGLPLFCQVAGVGSNVVVVGGLDSTTWEVSKSVFIFNFVTATWRRGADMPGVRRSFFGCTSDSERMVFVVGGHDRDKNALKSALVYDVTKNEWAALPDMTRERDECKAVFHRGKLHAIEGYCTEMQGRFESSAEVFDVTTMTWGSVQDGFLETAACPITCIPDPHSGDMYVCRGNGVVSQKGADCQVVAKFPAEVCNVAHVTTLRDRMMVIGSARFGEPQTSFILDLRNYKWEEMEIPEEFSGHVHSSCYLEI